MTRRRTRKIDDVALAFILARREAQAAENKAKLAQEALMEIMTEPKMLVDLGEGNFAQITLVASKRVKWAAASVKKILPVKFWNRVKVEAVDKTILEAMITSGELSAFDLAPAKEETISEPYLRLTEKPCPANVVPITQTRKDDIA